MYRIGEAACRTGLTPDTLRYSREFWRPLRGYVSTCEQRLRVQVADDCPVTKELRTQKSKGNGK